MAISIGERIPACELSQMTSDGPRKISTAALFSQKKVVLFGVPGAFTPTCSAKHLPGFVRLADEIKDKGYDTIACISVNDVFVMGAWGVDQKVDQKVTMIADGSAAFVSLIGLNLDRTNGGMGMRCERFLLTANNEIVTSLEVDKAGTFEKTSAEAFLGTQT